jgi:hypothetical protein
VTAAIKRSAVEDFRPAFDWHNPDYGPIWRSRVEALERIRAEPHSLPILKSYYRDNIPQFITDWGVTYDPRNIEVDLPALMPFILFDKQIEFIEWVLRHWREREPGLCEKSRDMGVSWCAVGLACALCVLYSGMSIGFGSRKAEYVDKIGELKALLPKARVFMANLPQEFRAGWIEWRDAPLYRLYFPETGSAIGGEVGDDIGRGDRRAIYFVDEFAHFERGDLIERSLSQTTNCRIDMSSVRGMNNPFAQKRWGGKIDFFIFDWHDDPRKDDAWYAKQCSLLDPVIVAQEIDRDYSASVEGIVIPGVWARACVDACKKLGIEPTGAKLASLDIADEGVDKNAMCGTHGVQVDFLEEWSGKGADLYGTCEKAFRLCDEFGYRGFRYDADGLGAGLRGDARVLNEKRATVGAQPNQVAGWRGSEAVVDPDGIVEGTKGLDGLDKGRTNKDYFANRKAQGWWALRRRVQKTYRWIVEGVKCDPDEIISFDSKMPLCMKLISELSQVTYKFNEPGKMIINKKPNGMPSPNLADAVMMRYAPGDNAPLVVTPNLLFAAAAMPRRRRY